MRVPDSVLLLVGTHADQCKDAEERRKKKEDIEKKTQDLLEERMSNLDQQISNIIDKSQQDEFSEHLTQLHQLKGYTLKVLCNLHSYMIIDRTFPDHCEQIEEWELGHMMLYFFFYTSIQSLIIQLLIVVRVWKLNMNYLVMYLLILNPFPVQGF